MNQDNPLDDRASSMRKSIADNAHASGLPLVDHAESQAGGAEMSPPLSDYVAIQVRAINTVPDQIRKLERQLKAAQNSISARDRRILEMQEDIQKCVRQRPAVSFFTYF